MSPVFKKVKEYVLTDWPSKDMLDDNLKIYYNLRDELHVLDDILFKCNRFLVPPSMRRDMLNRLHKGHQGQEKCKLLARQSVFWPNINSDISNMVMNCETCLKYSNLNRKEPMVERKLPTKPWEIISSDLFDFGGSLYNVIVDY